MRICFLCKKVYCSGNSIYLLILRIRLKEKILTKYPLMILDIFNWLHNMGKLEYIKQVNEEGKVFLNEDFIYAVINCGYDYAYEKHLRRIQYVGSRKI